MNRSTIKALIQKTGYNPRIKTGSSAVSADIWNLESEQSHEFIANENKILFVTKGRLNCSLQGYLDEHIYPHVMVLIPAGLYCCITAESEANLLCLKLGETINYPECTQYTNSEQNGIRQGAERVPILEFTSLITSYVTCLNYSVKQGVKDNKYMRIKAYELFCLMALCYSYEKRSLFFSMISSEHNEFSEFIYRNYRKATSIKQLANMSCYSLSGFDKHFRKVFGISPSRWIAQRKAVDIHRELCSNGKTLKQISFEYGFSSAAHFSKFCKAHMSLSPGAIRRQAFGMFRKNAPSDQKGKNGKKDGEFV